MALLNTDMIKKDTMDTVITRPMLRLNKSQRSDANGNTIIGELRNVNMSLKDTMSEYDTKDDMFIAYTTFMEFKKTVKDSGLSPIRKVALMTTIISDIENKDVRKLVSLLNNKVMIKNVIDKMYIVDAIDFEILEDGQCLYSFMRNVYLGDGSLLTENTICQAQAKNEKLKSSDILKGSTLKIENEFIQLANKYQTEKVKFKSFKEYMEFNKVLISEINKELYETKTKIINNYRVR